MVRARFNSVDSRAGEGEIQGSPTLFLALAVLFSPLPVGAEPRYTPSLGDSVLLWGAMVVLHVLLVGVAAGLSLTFVRRPGPAGRRRRIVVAAVLSVVLIAAAWGSGLMSLAMLVLTILGAGRTM